MWEVNIYFIPTFVSHLYRVSTLWESTSVFIMLYKPLIFPVFNVFFNFVCDIFTLVDRAGPVFRHNHQIRSVSCERCESSFEIGSNHLVFVSLHRQHVCNRTTSWSASIVAESRSQPRPAYWPARLRPSYAPANMATT